MLLPYLCLIFCFQVTTAQYAARELDLLLRDSAFRAVARQKTGVIYDANAPSTLSGVKMAAVRLRSGSLRRKGVASFKEFHIPIGIVEQPYVERLVLVYQNLANWSSLYYPLHGYTFLAPVLGLLAYDAAANSSQLDIRPLKDPISIKFSDLQSKGSSPMCVYFGLDGSVGFNNVVEERTCLATKQGHFSIVVEESSVAPAPAPGGGGATSTSTSAASIGGGKGRRKEVGRIVGYVFGGVILLVFLGILFGYVNKRRRRKEIEQIKEAAEWGLDWSMISIGEMKAPVAMETRTKPSIENDYWP